jgi:hypothetical protein
MIFAADDQGSRIDTTRLLIEWVCIAAATGAAWVVFGLCSKLPKTDKKPKSGSGEPPEES